LRSIQGIFICGFILRKILYQILHTPNPSQEGYVPSKGRLLFTDLIINVLNIF
jgi:hypothetical protein